MDGESEFKGETVEELSLLVEDVDLVPCCYELRCGERGRAGGELVVGGRVGTAKGLTMTCSSLCCAIVTVASPELGTAIAALCRTSEGS